MEMLTQGLPIAVVLLLLLGIVQLIVRRFHFDSEDVLDIRDANGGAGELRLSSLKAASPAKKEELLRNAKLA